MAKRALRAWKPLAADSLNSNDEENATVNLAPSDKTDKFVRGMGEWLLFFLIFSLLIGGTESIAKVMPSSAGDIVEVFSNWKNHATPLRLVYTSSHGGGDVDGMISEFDWPRVEFVSLHLEMEFDLDGATWERVSSNGDLPNAPRALVATLPSGVTLHFSEINSTAPLR